jgi:hypothetical protein
VSDEHDGLGIAVTVQEKPAHIIGFTTGDDPKAIVLYCDDGTFDTVELYDVKATL